MYRLSTSELEGIRSTPLPVYSAFPSLAKRDIHALLIQMGKELAKHQKKSTIVLHGGSALSFHLKASRFAHDIDYTTLSDDNGLLKSATKTIARRHGLPEDWMNDAVSLVTSDLSKEGIELYGQFPIDDPHLAVFIASPASILAMKAHQVRSSSYSKDPEDIWNLLEVCHITTWEGLKENILHFYPDHVIEERDEYVLKDLIEARNKGEKYHPMMGL